MKEKVCSYWKIKRKPNDWQKVTGMFGNNLMIQEHNAFVTSEVEILSSVPL